MMENMKKAEFRQYEMYKNTGIELIDEIPSHWKLYKAKFIFKHIIEYSKTGEEELLSVSEYYGVAAKSEMNEDSEFLTRAATLEGYKKNNKNDLIINIMLAWKKALGVAPIDGIVSPAYAVFRIIDLEKHDPRFYHYLLRTELYATEFKRFSTGIIDSRLRLYPESFNNIILLTPPYTEQVDISNFLDHEINKIDDTIEKSRQLIQLLKEQRLAIINEAVTKGLDPNVPMKDSGIEWLGAVPVNWEIKRLKFIANVRSGVTKGKDLSGKEVIEFPYLRVANVQDGYIDLSDVATIQVAEGEEKRYQLKYGDVLMNEGGDYDKLGRGAKWEAQIEPCLHQNHVFAVRPNDLSYSDWLDLITSTSYAKFYFMLHSKQSTNLASISSFSIKELPILLPPHNEREYIIKYIKEKTIKVDTLISKVRLQIQKLQEYRQSLISEAVTGKINVRNYGKETQE
ncbi:restriction endonuclease subunit S [Paenibacillus sp. UMB7766-LJ446]|uniref:restriction endonuclease subunit S n=1 Tax=Paenibacillus sp. UMB7766-LJ446 TaxID=3046313 RepID=UPI00254E75CC|nr:restriction endonuclease subunit S [Paenibacillus sp. UMB7766-LJ446]MDK8193491.1 restriction endonuclease subunit S [Paenibacillus sp. UMB7766-LJ446]